MALRSKAAAALLPLAHLPTPSLPTCRRLPALRMSTELAPQQGAAPPASQEQQQQGEAELQERIAWAARMRQQFSPEGMCRPDGSIDQVQVAHADRLSPVGK